jgi:hypothetical protein
MTEAAIETFIARLRDRPWIEPALVDLVAHGLRTAVRDPDPSLWQQLREVIRDKDDLVGHQLAEIGRIARRHLNVERARRASH